MLLYAYSPVSLQNRLIRHGVVKVKLLLTYPVTVGVVGAPQTPVVVVMLKLKFLEPLTNKLV